jgi:hypothetical protein
MQNNFQTLLLRFAFVAFATPLFAQNTLEQTIQALDKKLVAVEVNKTKSDASVTSDKKSTCNAIFSIEETNAKGKTSIETYEIGFSELSASLLRANTKGNVREVEVTTKDRLAFIKYSQDGDFKEYVNRFSLPAFDNDAAKDIIELFKTAIETCEKMPDACPKTKMMTDAAAQVKSLVGKVVINDMQTEQTLTFDKDIATRATLNVKENNKGKTNEQNYRFDFADFADNKVKFNVSGKKLKINIFSRNGDLIQRSDDDGKCQSNDNELEFLAADIEQAKCLVKTLQTLITAARDEADKRLPMLADADAALQLAAKNVQSFDQCNNSREQALIPKNISTYSISTTNQNGKKSLKETFDFNFTDLNPKSIEIRPSSNSILVRVRTNDSEKYIRVSKDGEIQNYDNEILIYTKTGEEAKLLVHAFKKAIELAPKTVANLCESRGAAALDCAVKLVKNIKQGDNEMNQKLERLPDNDFKLRLSTDLIKVKTNEQITYELNMKDIDPRRITLQVSGRNVSVQLRAKNGEKIIKINKKDKTTYDNELDIAVEDIEAGRALLQTLQKVLDGL